MAKVATVLHQFFLEDGLSYGVKQRVPAALATPMRTVWRPSGTERGEVDLAEHQCMVERVRAGDTIAWEPLYHHVYPRLRAYALSHADRTQCDDLVSETLARAVGGVDRFRWDGAGFDAWLFGILRRVCSEHHRRQIRRQAEYRVTAVSDGSEPGDGVELEEEHAEVRRAFELLRPPEREVLELRVITGLSVEDVARLLGKASGAVRTGQSRALANLRMLIEPRPGSERLAR
jgi:RNA polymerase sigma-70 factor (ECF subfamily)